MIHIADRTIVSMSKDARPTMTDDLIASAECLTAEDFHGYGRLPIPQPIDGQITELMQVWAALSPSERSAASLRVSDRQSLRLKAYSERMASFAVRTLDTEKIFFGLLALGVDGWRGDWREKVLVLSLHYDAVQRIDEDPEDMFERAAALLSPEAGAALASYLRRSPENKTIKVMGYVAASDDDGFRYHRTW
jgi:hypothetical protein